MCALKTSLVYIFATLYIIGMNFRTTIHIPPSENQLQHKDQLMLLGSCFTESIGERLLKAKFNVGVNPFGIQYNPLSVAQTFEELLEHKVYTEDNLFEHEGRWHSFMHHSRFSGNEKATTLSNINDSIQSAIGQLQVTKFLFITFGTAWVYELQEGGEIVSNCHKLPDKQFTRRRLSVEEIVSSYTSLIKQLQTNISINQQIIFTVSPIRHWKDGAHENNLSKSILLLAIDKLVQAFKNVSYFPSYELVLDDLRDYRFYTEDMLHPNSTAIDYIWSRFAEGYFSDETKSIAKEMEKLSKALAHSPFNKEGEEYHRFCVKQLDKIALAEKKYPAINFELEKQTYK